MLSLIVIVIVIVNRSLIVLSMMRLLFFFGSLSSFAIFAKQILFLKRCPALTKEPDFGGFGYNPVGLCNVVHGTKYSPAGLVFSVGMDR